jgi:hypothetical protein
LTTHHSSVDDRRSVEEEVGLVATALRVAVDRHPSARQLSAYHRGDELSPADTETLRDHLAQCPECADLVLDLDGFGALATQVDDEEWEGRKAAVWRSLRSSISDDGKAAPRTSSFGSRRSLRHRVPIHWAPLAAAALLALTIGLGGWLALERQAAELTRAREQLAQAGERIIELEGAAVEAPQTPQLVVPSHDLFPPSFRRSAEVLKTLVIPREAQFFLLQLHTLDTASHPDHALQILRPDGSEVWSGSGLRRTPEGSFRIALPRRLLLAGRYRLELSALGGASPQILGLYELTIEHR